MQAAKTSTDNKATAKNVNQVPFATEEEFNRYFDNLDKIASGGIQLAASTTSSGTTEKLTSPEESIDQASRICYPTSTTLYIDNDDPGNLANSESEDDLLLSTSKGEKSPFKIFAFEDAKGSEGVWCARTPSGGGVRRLLVGYFYHAAPF
ncbi:hypothetical protein VFPPC_01944 [Pochonia chlamydosporia 170]|uniref:Uncharacterized protein n=1 Tax=Pochonia chlamydosporia 170 TaxID=1380566 RepID=A0A179F723_METCM|nr:hypothetical protein VFPPC_01944 [Pochonia chlamydosporia 170]OAQ60899.1 hypothetical protein VFPPC_01944 [Pochonia chlamydosporia 170]